MPATLQSITGKRVTLNVPVDKGNPESGSVRIVYKPRAFTPRLEKAIRLAAENEGTDEDAALYRVLQQVCTVIVEWDLRATDDAPEPIPLTPEGLQDVPYAFIMELFEAIRADQEPDPTTGKGSQRRS